MPQKIVLRGTESARAFTFPLEGPRKLFRASGISEDYEKTRREFVRQMGIQYPVQLDTIGFLPIVYHHSVPSYAGKIARLSRQAHPGVSKAPQDPFCSFKFVGTSYLEAEGVSHPVHGRKQEADIDCFA